MICLDIPINCGVLRRVKVLVLFGFVHPVTDVDDRELGEFSMEYKVRLQFVLPAITRLTLNPQNHAPVLPNLQKDLEDAYRKTLPQAKK